MDWLWCVAGLSVLSAMIVSWRLSPVAAEARRGDDWRRPSLNRRRPSLSQQVCFTLSTSRGGREEWRKFGFSDTPPPTPHAHTHILHTYPSCSVHTIPSACRHQWLKETSLKMDGWSFLKYYLERCLPSRVSEVTCCVSHIDACFIKRSRLTENTTDGTDR